MPPAPLSEPCRQPIPQAGQRSLWLGGGCPGRDMAPRGWGMAWLPPPSPAMRLAFPGPGADSLQPSSQGEGSAVPSGAVRLPAPRHSDKPAPVSPVPCSGRAALPALGQLGVVKALRPPTLRCFGSAGTPLQPKQPLCPPPCLAPRLSLGNRSSRPWSKALRQPRTAQRRARRAVSLFFGGVGPGKEPRQPTGIKASGVS